MLSAVKLKLWHRLTFYHIRNGGVTWLRFLSQKETYLFMCSCGWHNWWARKLEWRTRFRALIFCSWRHHKWNSWKDTKVGPAWQDEEGGWHSTIDEGPEEEVFILGSMRQCERCYQCEQSKA